MNHLRRSEKDLIIKFTRRYNSINQYYCFYPSHNEVAYPHYHPPHPPRKSRRGPKKNKHPWDNFDNQKDQNNKKPHHPSNSNSKTNRHHYNYYYNPKMVSKESKSLQQFLMNIDWMPRPDSDNERLRQQALITLETALCQWAASLQSLRPATLENNKWQRPRVTLITFGSYRLQAHRPDADLDVLALCPPTCTRDDFFTSLPALLKSFHPSIQDVHPIPAAYTPVIKFKIGSIHVDLLFGRVSDTTKLLQHQQRSTSPLLLNDNNKSQHHRPRVEYMIDDSDLVEMDESGVRSMNGARVTQYILASVPNVRHFRIVLCAVKEWASMHGIYSNVLGFLGGVNWAILVAWVCRRHPNHKPSSLLRTFFQTFATWHWPKPVTLGPIQDQPPEGVASMTAWNPLTNPRDARHLMPIITPVFPSMNSSYNVGIPQQRRIQDELTRAAFLLGHDDAQWRSLYQPSDFFQRHANFLQITIRASNSEDFFKWLRLCESRLRILIAALDGPEASAWPFAKCFKRGPAMAGGHHEGVFFIGLRFAVGVESINIKKYAKDFLYNHINSWEGRKPGMDFLMAHVIQEALPFDLIEQNLKSNGSVCSFVTDPANTTKDADSIADSFADTDDDETAGDEAREKVPSVVVGDEPDFADPEDPAQPGRSSSKLLRSKLSGEDLSLMSPTKRRRSNIMDPEPSEE